MRDKAFYLIALIVITALTLFLHYKKVDPFESFSLRFNDVNFALQKKEPSDRMVFVAVDEPSVNEFGRWPWDRRIIAKGIEKLSMADVVLMDMIFSESTNPQQDAALADALESLQSSVCGFFLRDSTTQKITDDELSTLEDSSLDLLQSQIAEFKNPSFSFKPDAEMNIASISSSCTLSGSFSTLPENDNLFRSYPVAVYYDNILYPSLGIQGLRIALNKDIKRADANHVTLDGHTINVNKHGFTRLNFYKRNQYKVISFLDVFKGKIKPEFFKNKIVILGITEVGAGDVASTPIGHIPGPLLHYTFLSNFLQNQLIEEPRNITSMLIIIMVILPIVLVMLIRKISYRAFINIVFYLIVYAVVRYLFVTQNIYIDLFYPLLALILSLVTVEGIAFNIQERDEKFMRDAFSSYLSEDLLSELIKNPKALALGGEKKELSILFSDIRSFTTISESMDPVSLIKLLNRYFTPMTNAVLENKGMLDKYIGDAVMAFFNAPVDVTEHADAACKTALEMIERLNTLNEKLVLENIKPIRIGIGINTAEVVVGNMGSDTRFNYTVIGDGVNLASRVEGLTKNYGISILITEFTVAELKQEFVYRQIEPVKVKGKDEAVLLYELMPNNEKSLTMKTIYDEALEAYKNNELEKAQKLFQELEEKYEDSVSAYFLPKIEDGHPWGVHKMTTK